MNTGQLAEIFVEVADTLGDPFDLPGFLQTLTGHAAQVTGWSAVGLTLTTAAGDLEQVAASTDEALTLQLFQVHHGEGPSVDARHLGLPVISTDLTGENGRWPKLAPKAVEMGMLAVHAFPMCLRGQQIGAINAFSDTPGHLPTVVTTIMQALADVATISLIQQASLERATTLVGQLQHALKSRVIIEQAKGALSFAFDIGVDDAFEILRRHARRNGLKLTNLARDVVRHHITIPAPRGLPPD